MAIYFDNAATTKVSEKVLQKTIEIMKDNYANPSALYDFAMQAESEIINAEKIMANLLRVKQNEIVFTSGGTESNAMAILGVANAYARKGKHLITVKTEHPSVKENMKYLAENGYDVTELDVDEKGYVDVQQLSAAITEQTILLSVMLVNNESGVMQDIQQMGNILKQKNANAKFHVDAVQGFGKMPIPMQYVDLLSVSAHKIHGMKGVGALYIKSGTRVQPLFYGGGQQRGLRVGTHNVAGIASLAVAAEELYSEMNSQSQRMAKIKTILLQITHRLDDILPNGDIVSGSPYILNCSFLGVKAEVLLHALEAEGIYVSTGAACSAKRAGKQWQLPKERAESAIRFSFSRYNTEEEAEICLEALQRIVPKLRSVMKGNSL